jgi:hypothetical protein
MPARCVATGIGFLLVSYWQAGLYAAGESPIIAERSKGFIMGRRELVSTVADL